MFMRNGVSTLLILLATGSLVAQGQAVENPELQTASERFALLSRQESRPVPASAEDAEGIVAPSPRLWMRAEYMIWWIKQANSPILVTSGDPGDAIPGALNAPNTAALFGGSGLDFFDRKGGRFSGGWWFD